MNRTNFFDGMEVSTGDLQYAQSALAQQIKDSRTDIMDAGVTSAVNSYVQLDPATNGSLNTPIRNTPTIRILPFSAYTYTGERIQTALTFGLALDLSDLAGTNSRRLGTQGSLADEDFGWENGATYYICVRYIERGARPKPQEDTAIPYASRVYSGYEFYALRQGVDSFIVDGVNPYIILATATYSESTVGGTTTKTLTIQNEGITQYATIDGSRVGIEPADIVTGSYAPQDSTNNSKITLSDHIHAIYDPDAVSAQNPHGITAEYLGIDTKSVPRHEKMYHSDGLLGDRESTSSALYATVIEQVGTVDLLKVYNLQNGELLHYNGTSIEYFSSRDVVFANIILSDTNGIWPDGRYSLYISTQTNNIFIAVPDNSVATSRRYTITYNTSTSESRTPILDTQINPDIHYKLYTIEFKSVKGSNYVGLVSSNYEKLTDLRTFGSIAAENLQVDTSGKFTFPNTFKVNTLEFEDGSTLKSGIELLKFGTTSNCIYTAPYGVFSVSNDVIEIKQGLSLFCANGLDTDGTYKSVLTTFSVNTSAPTSAPGTEGIYYIFTGEYSGSATQGVWYVSDYIMSSNQPTSPVNNTLWYNTDKNELRFYSLSGWENPIVAAKLGYIVVNALGHVSEVHPDAPISIVNYSNYKRLIGVDQNCKALGTNVLTDEAKQKIINWSLPDYNSAIAISSPTTEHTAEVDGYVCAFICQYAWGDTYLLINGTTNLHVGFSSGTDYNNWKGYLIPYLISKGETYKFTNTGGNVERFEALFIPLKGAD